MRSIVVAIAFLVTGACDRSAAPAGTAAEPSSAPAIAPATESQATSTPTFTDRVWLRADAGSAPGTMQIFLSDGTLISDSCFETYRLSSWRLDGDQLAWSEDGVDIRARVVSVDSDAPTLRLMLRGGEEEQRFNAATVPYVCPDMPR
jgi:hypothetical protein